MGKKQQKQKQREWENKRKRVDEENSELRIAGRGRLSGQQGAHYPHAEVLCLSTEHHYYCQTIPPTMASSPHHRLPLPIPHLSFC